MPGELRVRVLGSFRIDGVDLTALRSRQARTVLKVLAVAGGEPVTADALIDAVWPDSLPADPDRDLAVLVSRVRSVLGHERVERGDGGYRLIAEWYDRRELDVLAGEAAAREASGDLAGARSAAEAAVALTGGELLAGEPDAEWLKPARAKTARAAAAARLIAARTALAAGMPIDAVRHAEHALDHDPYDEEALRVVMAAHAAAGRPASALAAYAAMRSRLAEDLGVSPTEETAALHADILTGGRTVAASPITTSVTPLRLVGRSTQLAALDAAFARSRRQAVVVDVVGEVGVGKTALAEAWSARAQAAGARVLRGRCAPALDLALQPLADALAGIEPLDAVAPEATAVDQPGAPWPSLPGPLATSAAMRLGVYAHVSSVLRRLSPPEGLVVVLDDVHRADPVTIGWLGHLTRRPAELPVLVLGTRVDEGDVEVPSTDVLAVPPLDETETAELVGAERAAELHRRTGGNPLLLTELAGNGEELPPSIVEAVAGRLRRCGDAAATLRAAAVLGADIDLDLLAGVLGRSPVELLEHLDEGQRRAFLSERNGVMTFRHEVVRDAIASDTTAARRMWLHRAAAQVLSQRSDTNPLELARHAEAAGDRRLAALALADAADVGRSRFDLDGAERLFDSAIDLDDTAELRLRRARLRLARNDIAGADEDAEAALGAGAGARALELRAWAARNRHDMETAIRLGTAGAAAAEDGPTAASCLLAVALARRGLGDLTGAERTMEAAIAAGPPPSLGVEAWVGVLRVHQGRAEEALTALQPLIGAEAGGLLSFWVEHVLQMATHANGLVGRVGDALELLARLEAELKRRGSDSRYRGLAHTYRSWLLRNLGVARAEDEARAALAAAVTDEIRAQAGLDLADTLLLIGRGDEAAGPLSDATPILDTPWFNNRWRAEQRAAAISARLHLAVGDPHSALDAAAVVVATATERGDARYATIGRLLHARATARLGLPVDEVQLAADLDRLSSVAALEAWWLAADVADDTGFAAARDTASAAGRRLVLAAGEHADSLRQALDRRLA